MPLTLGYFSLNSCMKVGDMVNNEQKTQAYSIQSFLCNAGSVVGYLFPFIFTFLGVQNVAPEGVIPNSVIYSFYVGAAILILCSIYTIINVKEYSPAEMAEFSGEAADEALTQGTSSKTSISYTFFSIGLVQFFCWAAFMFMWSYSTGAIADMCWNTTDAHSAGYQDAANWNGVVYAVQAVGSVIWAACIPFVSKALRSDKMTYSLSLILGGLGFVGMMFIHDQHVLFVSYALVGCAWAAMLAFPFVFFTNALNGNPKMGTYLGLFNCAICLPQIVAAVCGGFILSAVGGSQVMMLVIAGVFLFLGALSVMTIRK